MSDIRVCDKCKKQVSYSDGMDWPKFRFGTNQYDLCIDCATRVANFIEAGINGNRT